MDFNCKTCNAEFTVDDLDVGDLLLDQIDDDFSGLAEGGGTTNGNFTVTYDHICEDCTAETSIELTVNADATIDDQYILSEVDDVQIIDAQYTGNGQAAPDAGVVSTDYQAFEEASMLAELEAEFDHFDGDESYLQVEITNICGEYFTSSIPGKRPVAGFAKSFSLAQRSIVGGVYTLSNYKAIIEPFRQAICNAVDIRIVVDHKQAQNQNVRAAMTILSDIGVKLKTWSPSTSPYASMHMKFLVIDETFRLKGSFNWTYTAAEHSYEDLDISQNEDSVQAYLSVFNTIWNNGTTWTPVV